MVTRRPGHSLPELIVAISFLGTTLAAIGGSTVLGAHWAARAMAQQEAIRSARAALDSLSSVSAPESGTRDGVAGLLSWTVAGARIHVTVLGPGDRLLAELHGRREPVVPVLPDVGADSSEAVP